MTSLEEKRKTAQNVRSEILDARVIANYGDPGLDEDYHFDILSRYVVVMIESCYRVLTTDKWFKMLAIVQRPRQLWIEANGGNSGNPTTQKRADAYGNVNVGAVSNYSVNGISRLNEAYTLGETIKIRKLPHPNTVSTNPAFFRTDFQTWEEGQKTYNAWHSEGSTLPYIADDPNGTKLTGLRQKTIQPVTGDWLFNFYLNKYQYESFMLSFADSSVTSNLSKIFQGEWRQGTPVYTANGGYLFDARKYVLLSSCEYEDVNIGNKARVGTNDCVPLVVTTPNSFPTPKVRAVGTINYNPSYSPIAR